MLSKSPPLINIKHILTLFVLEPLNLPPSDYLVIYVIFKWTVFMNPLDAKTVKNKEEAVLMFLNSYSLKSFLSFS